MPGDAVVRARIDHRLKQEAEAVLAAIRLTASDAIRLLMIRIAQDKALPFEPIFPNAEPIRGRKHDMHVTPQMRHHATTRAPDHFGFSGKRAAIACLYALPRGATQDEVNQAAAGLGSPQEGWINMLHQAKKWGHHVVSWDDQARGGKVHKLIFNPSHSAKSKIAPPTNWREMNKTPPGVNPTRFVGRRKVRR
jgi:DNA-damage-inducible protein J